MGNVKVLEGLPPFIYSGSNLSEMLKSAKILGKCLEDTRKTRRIRCKSVDAVELFRLSSETSSLSLVSKKSLEKKKKQSGIDPRLEQSPLAKRPSKTDQGKSTTSASAQASSSSSSNSSLSKSSMRKSMSTNFLKKDDLNPRGIYIQVSSRRDMYSNASSGRSLEEARASAQIREDLRKQAWSEFLIKRSEMLLLNSLMKHLLYGTSSRSETSPKGV